MTEKVFNQENLKQYYGTILQKSPDLKTSACCCTDENLSPRVKAAMSQINDEVISRFYGCGSPLPPLLEGCTVVDLGCGTGRDAYVASHLVGPSGYVIGVDMTEEQLAVAKRNLDSQMKRFGYQKPNVDFRLGYIEDLKALDIADHSVDVVMSNCVLNLAPDKKAVFSEIFRILKPGGELYFSDVFAGCRVPSHLHADPVLHGECLAGAMYREDFRRLLQELGCNDYRVVSSRLIELNSLEVEEKIGMIDFNSFNVMAFNLDSLEDLCEDYGQAAIYNGNIPEWPHFFDLDDHHRFFTAKPMLVCGNTAAMLRQTRYGDHFQIHGDRSVHFGPFECSPAATRSRENPNPGGACC
jgi:arsenite methyltransferase